MVNTKHIIYLKGGRLSSNVDLSKEIKFVTLTKFWNSFHIFISLCDCLHGMFNLTLKLKWNENDVWHINYKKYMKFNSIQSILYYLTLFTKYLFYAEKIWNCLIYIHLFPTFDLIYTSMCIPYPTPNIYMYGELPLRLEIRTYLHPRFHLI